MDDVYKGSDMCPTEIADCTIKEMYHRAFGKCSWQLTRPHHEDGSAEVTSETLLRIYNCILGRLGKKIDIIVNGGAPDARHDFPINLAYTYYLICGDVTQADLKTMLIARLTELLPHASQHTIQTAVSELMEIPDITLDTPLSPGCKEALKRHTEKLDKEIDSYMKKHPGRIEERRLQLDAELEEYFSRAPWRQRAGGHCKLCGATGVNMSTCPNNSKAKNPKYRKHLKN